MSASNADTGGRFLVKGDIIYSKTPMELISQKDGYLACEKGKCVGVFAEIPEGWRDASIAVYDHSGRLLIPGLSDLHTHAPQFSFRCLGGDLELLQWLEKYTFPEETKYKDAMYARQAYRDFVGILRRGATTRAVIFATVHLPGTLLLMEMLEESGVVTLVGKVNMDRNGPASLLEAGAQESLDATRAWLAQVQERGFERTRPILTPRFIPSCSDTLMAGLAAIQREYGLPVQSHLSENLGEIDWVRGLCPESGSYADAYLRRGLLGGEGCPTIMAHCVHSDPLETPLLLERGVWVAHCPESNTCLSSGIAPIRRFMDQGLRVGLGSDVAGGYSASMLHAVAEAVKVSKLRWRLVDDSAKPLSLAESFYLATKGGGEFFGKVGSFEPGYEFDLVVIDDQKGQPVRPRSIEERLEQVVYDDPSDRVVAKFVAGRRLSLG